MGSTNSLGDMDSKGLLAMAQSLLFKGLTTAEETILNVLVTQ
jgi:hypothetical protein